MTYRIAIVGRPNVGKSTLFNRLVGKKLAIVHDEPGVTRDWRSADTRLGGVPVQVIDTAGLEDRFDDSLESRMRRQTESAIRGADLVLFVIDARAGLTGLDEHFAAWLRKEDMEVMLICNKAEGRGAEAGGYEAYSLGLGDPNMVSAEHGIGTGELEIELSQRAEAAGATYEEPDLAMNLPLELEDEETAMAEVELDQPMRSYVTYTVDESKPIQIAIVGRPNAGKSTLINALLGEDRMLTGPEAGITRDAISVDYIHKNRDFKIFDTAGLRRRARITQSLEKMSAGDSLRSIKYAQIVILMIDADQGFEKQDLSIARHVIEEGRGLILALNKWDIIEDTTAALNLVRDRIETSMPQVRGVPLITLSALENKNCTRLLDAAVGLHKTWSARIATPVVNRWLREAVSSHPPPLVGGRRIKPRFMTQAKTRPPSFALFGNQVKDLPESYQRFLMNALRRDFDLEGPPLRLFLREGDNPFAKTKKR
ncbi:MAG: ribosome biogenesis GTPase Der [Alphaproteobacteria bacterium]